ncbi:MAG: flagellar motor protein MotB [Nitrospinae bacterium]|nr:flagellar motor protein MotB [Nitrospinota bacterium]
MARKRHHEDVPDEDPGIWLITFSDLLSLLLTFFIMLFALTSQQEEKYLGMLSKIGDALGGKSLVDRKTGLEVTQEKLQKFVQDNNLIRQVQLTSDTRGLVMFAEGDLFFDAGSAEIKPDIKRFLRRVGEIIKGTQYKVLVEGHTDDTVGQMEKFPSNWELSSARATAVVRYFIDEAGLEPYRFAAVGYAQFKPRYALIPENRPKNRRVELVILRETL